MNIGVDGVYQPHQPHQPHQLFYDYPVIVVRDLEEDELKQSGDMFDLALLACKYVLRTQGEEKAVDRYELTLELVSFIVETPLGQTLEEEELQSVLAFILNLLILPPHLEQRLNAELEKKYLTPNDMQYVPTYREVNFADAILKGRLGISIKEIRRLMRVEKKAEAMEKQAEAERQKAEADRINTIYLLNGEFNMPAERIAQSLKLELSYVQSILDKKPEKPKA